MTSIRITGLFRVQRILGMEIDPILADVTMAIAQEIQNEIAPYPPAPSYQGQRSWYVRGFGPHWRVKSGEVHKKRSSETLGRRWGIARKGLGAVLGNLASYSVYVHGKEDQNPVHAKRGWVTDATAHARVVEGGAIPRILGQAILHAVRKES